MMHILIWKVPYLNLLEKTGSLKRNLIFTWVVCTVVWFSGTVLHAGDELEAEFLAWAEQFDMHPTVLVGIGPKAFR